MGLKLAPAGAGIADEALVESARRGDALAWNILIRRYAGMVRARAAAFFLPGADLDDVVQEGMVGLCKAVRDYRADRQTPFAVFARLCIRRQIVTAVKMATRAKHRPLNTARSLDGPVGLGAPAGDTLLALVPLVGEGPEATVLRDLEHAAFERRLCQRLTPLERAAASGYLEGRSYHEIARCMGCSVKAVDNALQRAKRKLERARCRDDSS